MIPAVTTEAGDRTTACMLTPSHALHWWQTEAIYQVRRARQALTESMRAWHLGQAVQARRSARELRRRHASVAACSCVFPKMAQVGR